MWSYLNFQIYWKVKNQEKKTKNKEKKKTRFYYIIKFSSEFYSKVLSLIKSLSAWSINACVRVRAFKKMEKKFLQKGKNKIWLTGSKSYLGFWWIAKNPTSWFVEIHISEHFKW